MYVSSKPRVVAYEDVDEVDKSKVLRVSMLVPPEGFSTKDHG